MEWKPITESALWELILAAEARMEPPESKPWECVRIPPHKWKEPSYGDVGGGFRVVGIIGNTVIWYNDIEEGFNQSSYVDFGTIGEAGECPLKSVSARNLNWLTKWTPYDKTPYRFS